ncbi:4-oxalocrotonate decarboxylase [Chromobacterium sp. Panama]|uniref:2-keto-4-pentenoate hydratase n=1 Tax=Chromobacterium sp. Panama TaxID=2161826 RepID=UPI000D316DCA|nr:fumarylacetoacetate hydrolase family protein [Chromobacterium sp. Panama]PTU64780.1 4-oxalocrotonate decarboxylase [Chromobacterium sp. Panama]
MTDFVQNCARELDIATQTGEAVDQLSARRPFDLAQAYRIQQAGIALRQQRGERALGLKLGFTSRAKRVQMGVDALIWGELTDAMQLADGGELALGRLIHPRVEPEIAFITAQEISRPLSLAEAGPALAGVAPALEIIDSRYRDFRFSLEDVVADNCSSSHFVVGPLSPPDTPLDNLGVTLRFNGRPVQLGSSAAILGQPLRALMEVSALLHAEGRTLPAGSLLLAGAATAAEPLRAGLHVGVEIAGLGRCEFETEGSAA